MSDLISRQHVIDVLTGVIGHLRHFAEPDRKFLEIVAEYPKVCTYPEYEGKPYYSIKYEENGEMIVGFGTYNPEVLSQYLREYFISPHKNGKWKNIAFLTRECSECGAQFHELEYDNFCPNCGTDMREEDIPIEYFESGGK